MIYKVLSKLIVLSSAIALALAQQGPFTFAVSDSSNRLGLFSTDPSKGIAVSGLTDVSGIPAGSSIISIAFRPKNQKLYAYLSNNAIYTISIDGSSFAQAQLAFTTNCPISSSVSYSIDFNPVADALRILGSDRSNYRIPFATATTTANCVVDGQITYIDGTAGTPRPSAVAYTNSVPSPTATAEYMIDANQNIFSRVSVPNAGSSNFTSFLGFGADSITPLDFVFDSASNTNIGYFLNGNTLYRVAVPSGAIQRISNGYTSGKGLAIIPGFVSSCSTGSSISFRQGNSWKPAENKIAGVYDIVIQNRGTCIVNEIIVNLGFPSTCVITQQWNIETSTGVMAPRYTLTNFGSAIGAGKSFTGAGLILECQGSTLPSPTISVASNRCGSCGSASSK